MLRLQDRDLIQNHVYISATFFFSSGFFFMKVLISVVKRLIANKCKNVSFLHYILAFESRLNRQNSDPIRSNANANIFCHDHQKLGIFI